MFLLTSEHLHMHAFQESRWLCVFLLGALPALRRDAESSSPGRPALSRGLRWWRGPHASSAPPVFSR